MIYKRCGNSSIHIPQLSLDLSRNLDGYDAPESPLSCLHSALEAGICSWDISSETTEDFQRAEDLLKDFLDQGNNRNQLFLATGISPKHQPLFRNNGRKGIRQEMDRLLQKLNCEYIDLFYLSDPFRDGEPEEAAAALEYEIGKGRILYAGLDGFNTSDSQKWMDCLKEAGIPTLLVKQSYSPAIRQVEKTLDHLLEMTFTGLAVERPFDLSLEQRNSFLSLAEKRGQTLLQLILSWLFRQAYVHSVFLPMMPEKVLQNCCSWLDHPEISAEELQQLS